MGLTRADWDELRIKVYERDLLTGHGASGTNLSFAAWRRADPYGACVAWQLNPRLRGTCAGGIEFDHIHERGLTALSMKADDDEWHLQTACGWHHGTQRTGGSDWLTSSRGRELARQRLERLRAAA